MIVYKVPFQTIINTYPILDIASTLVRIILRYLRKSETHQQIQRFYLHDLVYTIKRAYN